MSRPYVSYRRLAANSLSAMLSAIEVYNKPRMAYRDEVTVVLIVNAWELALKAVLRKADKNIFYKKRRGESYRTLSIEDALKRIVEDKLFPSAVNGAALDANIRALIEYRNRAVHLYAVELSEMIYPFLQPSVLNYRDLMLEHFNADLADSITWQLLPLGAKAPAESIRFMKVDSGASSLVEVQDFITDLRRILDDAEKAGGDMGRVAAVFDVHLRSVKAVKSADLVVNVSQEGEHVIIKKSDPNRTHPYTAKELIQRVNKKRKGRDLTSYDHQALCWKEGLRDNPKMAWKHSKASLHTWSGEAVSHMANLDDIYYERIRIEYREDLRRRR